MKKFLPYLVPLLAFAALACFEQDYLWAAQEQNLFLHTPLFFHQCMESSGGMLTWAGTYLTQFFYYPMLGAGMLCLLWAFLMWLLKRTFRIPDQWLWLTVIPIAMLLLSDTGLGYWLYFLKLRGHLFVGTLGVIIATALTWGYKMMPRRAHIPYIIMTALIGYPLFGIYALLATLLMGVSKVRGGKLVISIMAVVLVPLLFYHFFYYLTPLGNIYWTALPIFNHNGVSDMQLYLPYAVIVLWLVVASLRPHLPKMVGLAAVALSVIITAWGWNKDGNFRRELSMRRQLERLDWQGMLQTISTANDEPTRAMCMMKNLALQRTGRLSKDINRYPDGFARPNAPFPVHAVHTIGKMLYLQYGIPNYCYRWCMEDGVEYGWSVEKLKLMAKCSLLNNEPAAARRYLSLLKKTDFHRSWARKYEAYVRQPGLIMQDDEFRAIIPLLRDDDFLTSDQSQLEPFLIEHLATMPGNNPIQEELRRIYFNFYMNRIRYVEK